jgi:hypothetical protein
MLSMRKYPDWLVVVIFDTPSRLSVTVTVAPASRAPVESCTVPSTPLENWATAVTAPRLPKRIAATSNLPKHLILVMIASFSELSASSEFVFARKSQRKNAS